jgi:branched-chain amino acid transport system ATP-binding protein
VPLLEGTGITKIFGGLIAVSNFNFNIEPGEIMGLIGPNGAGKTTVFNLISGALTPRSGTIRFKGKNITGLRPDQICRLGIARTFQSVKVFGNMSVLENIRIASLFGIGNKPVFSNGFKDIESIMEFTGLSVDKETLASEITLVKQKQLEIARALATKPELLLLDETMAGLNASEVTQAMDLVHRIREKGVTIFMIEHVMKAIMEICERIIVLHHGEKIAEGNPGEIASNKKVIEVYLGE